MNKNMSYYFSSLFFGPQQVLSTMINRYFIYYLLWYLLSIHHAQDFEIDTGHAMVSKAEMVFWR